MIPLRDENPTKRFPIVTVLLIGANFLLFFYELSLGNTLEPFIRVYGVIPARLVELNPNAYLTLISSLFLHGGWLHILGNMLYLWIFGDNIEDSMGHIRFFLFYLLCGLAATFTHVFVSPNSEIPTIGASGAISGVLGGYLLLFPKAKILTLIPVFYFIRIIRLPAYFILSFWIIFQLFQGIASIPGSQSSGGVAWFAHIGGFFAGLALIKLFQKR
jgi:membrane associated rhomboid family serine protease